MEIASFQKRGCTDTETVARGKTLDIEYLTRTSCLLHMLSLFYPYFSGQDQYIYFVFKKLFEYCSKLSLDCLIWKIRFRSVEYIDQVCSRACV